MKLLLIEDNPVVVSALRRGLRVRYLVDVARTGVDALHYVEINDYDVIILDLGLPDISGQTLCRRIRELPLPTPILVLTATQTMTDKVRLLDMGADDYMTKPFRLEELHARLRVLIRRGKGANTARLEAGDLVINTATRQVVRAGVPINLRRKEFDLLEYLMYHRGTVVTRAMIAEHVWNAEDSLWTNAIDVHIKRLRDKLDRPFTRPMILTVHGMGYRLSAVAAIAQPMELLTVGRSCD